MRSVGIVYHYDGNQASAESLYCFNAKLCRNLFQFLKNKVTYKGAFDWEIWISILDFGFRISQ